MLITHFVFLCASNGEVRSVKTAFFLQVYFNHNIIYCSPSEKVENARL